MNYAKSGLFAGLFVLSLLVSPAAALEADGVLVLYNADSGDSQQIADYYSQLHPGVNLLALQNVPTSEQVTADVYLNTIRPQVLSALDTSIDCIVTTRDLPVRIFNDGSSPSWSEYSSLESELARIDLVDTAAKMADQQYGWTPYSFNPYYNSNQSFSFEDHASFPVRLTSRLDGHEVQDVIRSLDDAQFPVVGLEKQKFIVDNDPDRYDRMSQLNAVLDDEGMNVVYDDTDDFIESVTGSVVGYAGHGVHGGAPANYILDDANGLDINPAKGSIFTSWESFNAYSFDEGGNRYGQGLVADWLAIGGTAGVGNVEEPGVSQVTVPNEDILFDRMLKGFTFAEAAWAAQAQVSWVGTVVGDPLMTWTPAEALLLGDTNLDWKVDLNDLCTMGGKYGSIFNGWKDGDFNGDGTVNTADLTILGQNFGAGGSSQGVPEPASMALLALGAVAMLRRR
jgi:uncharacterized protein (TIGR03790 family)